MNTCRVTKKFEFEAGHQLKSYTGNCSDKHGHSYKLRVTLEGTINEKTNMVVDFKELSKIVNRRVIKKLDHTFLNDLNIPEFKKNPTAEIMCFWVWKKLKPVLPELVEVILYETANSYATYRG